MPRPSKRPLSDESKAQLMALNDGPVVGPIQSAVRVFVESREILDEKKLAFAQIAYKLAWKLDIGAENQTASCSRELRETLNALSESKNDVSDFISQLSKPV